MHTDTVTQTVNAPVKSGRGGIKSDVIPLILSYANIVEEISGFVKLKKVGNNYLGLCPFHSEKTPSFHVSESKGFFHCFGCGKGGNVIGFLKDIKGESFSEVILYLKKKYNIPLEDTQYYKINKPAVDEEPLRKILNLSLNFYYENLFLYISSSRHIIKYLKERGIDESTAKEFKLGFAGFGNELAKLLSNNKADLELSVSSGLLVKKSGSANIYADRFINKLVVPIFDRNDEPIAFASRPVVQDVNGPKYINTNNSEVFVKSNTLYGLNKSLPFIKKENAVIVVEGYFDMIMLYSRGIKNVVATMGTALSKNHIINLSRLCDDIILLYDGDKAGISAINRGIELFEGFMDSSDKNIYAVALSGEDDPDSFVRKFGADKLAGFIKNNKKPPIDFALDYYIDKLLRGKDSRNENELIENNKNDDIIYSVGSVETVKKKIAVLKSLEPFLKRISNGIVVSHYINLISNRLGLKEEELRRYVFASNTYSAGEGISASAENFDGENGELDIESLIIVRLFCNPLLTDYINSDIINEFSDRDAVFIVKEIKSRSGAFKKKTANDAEDEPVFDNYRRHRDNIIEEIISRTENVPKWRGFYYSSSFLPDGMEGRDDVEDEKRDIKRLLVKLKIGNINKVCESLLKELKSGELNESERLSKFKDLKKLKYLSKEFQKKICSL